MSAPDGTYDGGGNDCRAGLSPNEPVYALAKKKVKKEMLKSTTLLSFCRPENAGGEWATALSFEASGQRTDTSWRNFAPFAPSTIKVRGRTT